ncbi:MAG: RAMP superfamily CRISPR-associated protein [Candidatus Methanomethylicaceae archaeon]
MQSISLKVARDDPRPRDSYTDLCGYLDASIIVDSDKLSFLHIGSGKEIFEVNINELKELYSKFKRVDESFLNKIKVKKEYDKFISTAKNIIIPGSSIKGNIRSRIELSFRGYNGIVKSCFINAGKPITKEPIEGTTGWRHYRIWKEVLSEDRGGPCNFTVMNKVCLLCDLFGTSGLKSLIDFNDFECVNAKIEYLDLPFDIKVQAISAGSEFKGRIYFRNLKEYELGLLLLGMGIKDSFEGRRVILGRFKYRSIMNSFKFGRVKYRLNELELSKYSRPLSIDNITLQPNTSIKGDLLNKLCKLLTDFTLKKFENEFRIIDEVKILDEL